MSIDPFVKEENESSSASDTEQMVANDDELEKEGNLFNLCHNCGEIFESKLSLEEHSKICCVDDKLDSKDDLPNKGLNACVISEATGEIKRTEVQIDEKGQNFPMTIQMRHPCDKCDKEFTRKRTLIQHNRHTHEGMPKKPTKRKMKRLLGVSFPCEKCDKVFKRKNALKKHSKNVHEDMPKKKPKEREGTRICFFCSLKVGSNSMYRHLVTVHYDERVNAKFKEIIESLKEKHVCPYCGQEFSTKSFYRSHCQAEHKDKVQKAKAVICIKCDKGFKDNGQLNEHVKQVHEVDPVLCVECDKTYPNRRLFSSHVRLVHEITEEKCPECGKDFKNKVRLVSHLRRVHIRDLDLHNKCKECPKAFKEREKLIAHIDRVHNKIRQFCCEMCNYKASSVFNLNLHRRKMHQATDHISRLQLINMIKEGKHPNCGSEVLKYLIKPIDEKNSQH